MFKKNINNPVFGGPDIGVCFDVYVTYIEGVYRMDFSWRDKKSLAVTFSNDGIHWQEPQITLRFNEASGWEDDINRNCVLKIDNMYKMWYTGQANGKSFIGYAESSDGISFERKYDNPIMVSETDFEGLSVMNPCVLFEDGIYKMWYAAGETYEPNVLCYAESIDGINWKKYESNPIFEKGTEEFEKDRVGGCQVIKTDDMGYLMFYIGYKNIDTACVCVAKSQDGKTNFIRSKNNPIVISTKGEWDEDSCYKPSAVWNRKDNILRLWYNGRKGTREYVGCAECDKRDLF